MVPVEIKKVLLDVGLSVTDLARELGLSRRTVHMYLAGRWINSAQRARIQGVVASAAAREKIEPPVLWSPAQPSVVSVVARRRQSAPAKTQ